MLLFWLLSDGMSFLFFIVVVALVVQVIRLSIRVDHLERTRRGDVPQPVAPAHEVAPVSAPSEPVAPVAVAPTPEFEPTPGERLIAWIKEDWLLKLGALLLLIGFGWFATYAFVHNWIGPAGRISLGLLAGVGFLALGTWRMRTHEQQGGVFLVLGSTIVLLTTYAAREVYDFFTPSSALALMFLSTVFVAGVSVLRKNTSLAMAGLILACAAPLLTASPTHDYVALFVYLLVVVIGAMGIVVVMGNAQLSLAALIIMGVYSMGYTIGSGSDKAVMLILAFAFTALFFLTNSIEIIRRKTADNTVNVITAAGSGLFVLGWILYAAQDEWQSLLIALWMMVFAVGAFALQRVTGNRVPFYTYACVGIGMLGAATAVELDGHALVIALTLEVAAVVMASYLILRDMDKSMVLSWLFVVPGLLAMESITSHHWHTDTYSSEFWVIATLSITLIALGVYLMREAKQRALATHMLSNALVIIGSIYAYILIWLRLHAGQHEPAHATMISLVIYTVIGLVVYVFGNVRDSRTCTWYAGILLTGVFGRLLLVDIWQMELTGRIITFLLIGTLFISTAFYGRRKTHAITHTSSTH
jgi:uncharacterized membrane protein